MSVRDRGEPSRAGVIAAFAAVYVIWGSTYLGIRIALETIPPLLMAGMRHLLAGIILYTFVRATGGAKPMRLHWRSAAIIGAMLLLGGNGGVCWSEQTVPSGLAALFVTTVPVWMVLFNWLRRDGVKPGLSEVAGVTMGLLGVVVLMGGLGSFGGETVDRAGAMVLVLASLSWSWGSIYARRAPLPTSPLMATAMEMLCGGVLLIGAALVRGEGSGFAFADVSLRSVLALSYLTVFGSLVAFSAYVWLLQVTTPARVGTYAFVNPVVAVVLGYFVAGETLAPRTIVATIIIVTAVILITVYGRRGLKPIEPRTATALPAAEQSVERKRHDDPALCEAC